MKGPCNHVEYKSTKQLHLKAWANQRRSNFSKMTIGKTLVHKFIFVFSKKLPFALTLTRCLFEPATELFR